MAFTAPSAANKGNRFRIGPRTDITVAVAELVVFNILQDTLMLIPTFGLQPARPCPDPNHGLDLGPTGYPPMLPPGSFKPEVPGWGNLLPSGRLQMPLLPGQAGPNSAAGLSCQPASLNSNEWPLFPGGKTVVAGCCPPAGHPDSDQPIKAPSGLPPAGNCCRPQTLPGPVRQTAREEESPCYVELIAATRVLDSTCRLEENALVWPFIPPGPTPGVPVKVLACRIKNLVSWSRLLPLPSGGRALAAAYYTYEVEILYNDSSGRTAAVTIPSGSRHQQAVVWYPGCGHLEVDVRVNCAGAVITSPVIPAPGLQPPPVYKPARVWLQARSAGKD